MTLTIDLVTLASDRHVTLTSDYVPPTVRYYVTLITDLVTLTPDLDVIFTTDREATYRPPTT